jgi:hypothetical protein
MSSALMVIVNISGWIQYSVSNKNFYDNTAYHFKDNEPGINGLELLHVAAENEATEWWILNNPAFPLVCKIKGSPLGIDCLLNKVSTTEK